MDKKPTPKPFLIQGAISPEVIASTIVNHQKKTHIGAHNIFLGQVRSDVVRGQNVIAIDYSVHKELAEQAVYGIREAAFAKFEITCMHIYHSVGLVDVGKLCFFVFVSTPKRHSIYPVTAFVVEEFKEKVPIFGKEMLEDGTYLWKENTPRAL